MNVLRLAWSSYQDEESLTKEQRFLNDRGFDYRRIEQNGPVPDKLSAYHALVINSQFNVDDSFLNIWEDGLILTASNGFDHIDLDACEKRGIPVARTPYTRAENVVNHTFVFLDALFRDLHRTGRIDQYGWKRSQAHENITTINEQTFGVLGYGVIGKLVVEEAISRGANEVLVHDPYRENNVSESSFQWVNRETLFEESDVLSLHANLNEDTKEIINKSTLNIMKDDAYLINTARGKQINWNDLLQCLEQDKLGGAALDVFPEEPPSESNELNVNGLLTSPHSAGFSPNMLKQLREEIAVVLKSYKNQEEPINKISDRRN